MILRMTCFLAVADLGATSFFEAAETTFLFAAVLVGLLGLAADFFVCSFTDPESARTGRDLPDFFAFTAIEAGFPSFGEGASDLFSVANG